MNENEETPMWEISARDASGRVWTTFYEGGDRESVRNAFATTMPLTIGSDSPVVITRVVSS